ncbi:hypothetical protein BGW39_006565 [Mortierella sp. 14UC]|nr:hypothetical protein BGW39_006565 [Mortierella sp. 14UC]
MYICYQLGSKDPGDWNIRVHGWAFSKRSNRRKRLVMSVARKIAGVTKDNKVYETLESRFGMFLASNTQGAQFMVQCVGLASATHMELAGGSDSMSNPTVDVLIDEIKSSESEGGLADTEASSDQVIFQQSSEKDQGDSRMRSVVAGGHGSTQPPLQHAAITALKSQLSEQVRKSAQEEQRKQLNDAAQLHDVNTSIMSAAVDQLDAGVQETMQIDTSVEAETESTFSSRLSRGTALFKNVVRKVKSSSVYSSNNGASTDSLKLASSVPGHNNNISDASSADEPPRPMVVTRAASGPSVLTEDMTRQEDLGKEVFPTVHVASRPGGHFDGILRMSSGEVNAHRSKDSDAGHLRFLKLHAHHADMPDPCHGVANLIDSEGVSIISDIDDTIKETNVTAGARIILRNTFLKDMMEVEGMASVYKRWWNQGAAIHYVSNSPWQLIPSLLEFFHAHMFPPGSAHLRLHDNVLKTYFTAPGENKRRCIREILTDFPDRKFILVGDSGEIDMEIYTEMALEFPVQVVKIFIRDITTARLKEMVSKIPSIRSLSFSSLLLPKTPLGLFNRRGSNTNTIGSAASNDNASTSNVGTITITDDEYDNDEEDGGEDINHIHNNHDETFESEIPRGLGDFNLERPRYPNHGGPMSTRLDPSGPLTPPAISRSITPTSSTTSSPRLQPKQITTSVKAIFGSTFRRSSPNNNNHYNKQAASNGWNALRKRPGSMSPASPLSEGVIPMTGYPFPRVESETSSSASSLSRHQQQHQQRSWRNGGAYDEDYGQNLTLSTNSSAPSNAVKAADKSSHGSTDIFDDEDQYIMLQQQQQPQQRTNTSSFTPFTNSPPCSPKIPIHRATGYIARQEPHPLEMAMTAASPVDAPLNIGQGRVLEPLLNSPSLSPSSPSLAATTPSSFTNPKNPLEVWLERVQQCRRRLPKGMLTLFESAEELERCEIVQEVFKKYGGDSSSHDQEQGLQGQRQHQQQQHQQHGYWKSETYDDKGTDLGNDKGVAFGARSDSSVQMNLVSRSATSINTTTTTTTTTSSQKPCRDSVSTMTTSINSFSISARTNSDLTSATKHIEVSTSQHSGHGGYTDPDVDGIFKSVMAI